MNDKRAAALSRAASAVRLLRGMGGVVAGMILLYLGASGKVIPADGLDASAELGRAIGDSGVIAIACGVGTFFIFFFGRWVISALKLLRST